MYFEGYVIVENEQPSLINEPMKCSSVDEYVKTVVELIRGCQEVHDHEGEDAVVQKLLAHDFEVNTEDNYTEIFVRV